MSNSNMESVVAAAKFLDKHVGKFSWLTKDWRTKIDLGTLRMLSSHKCVLGQLAGSYATADACFFRLDGWDDNILAFGGLQKEWIEYLNRIDEKAKWRGKNSHKLIKDVVNVTLGDKRYVAFVDHYNSARFLSILDFRNFYELVPVYQHKRWDVLVNQAGVFFLVEEDGGGRVIDLSTLTHQSLAYWEENGFVFTPRPDKTGSGLWRSLYTSSV